ncbi:hypothetical protein [Schaalia sp. JY-X159]|uniref:hypothetical protein n=1 Tax=Schaalia sp. JY-X159 TaxID=2758575 RepID=UPI00165EA3CD|nr:hypothetical protein [Schaalia sp. JY-X159]
MRFIPQARFTLNFRVENDVEGLRWCHVEIAMFSDTNLGKERLIRKATVLV